jgi:formylglycine-generating enzyme required for sulfatase activity
VIGDVAWYNGNSGGVTHTVATKAPNACGLYDMSGNVWEWTQDWYSSSYYSSSPDTDPGGATSGGTRVVRGGSWFYDPTFARVAYRFRFYPSYRYNFSGLRLLRTIPGEYVGAHGGTMIKIDAQTFEMGCTAGMSSCALDESPAHDVTLTNDFYIGETEVTQGEYEAMMGTNPSFFSGCGADCPVEQVSWHMSAAFANAVSDSEGLEQCYTCTGSGTSTNCTIAAEPYSCGGYRLPTEAEWEAAARCGEDTLYAGSTVIGDVALYRFNSGLTLHTVATKASNACGLYDMSGNLWEWTQDWYSSSSYSSSPGTDPGGATSGDYRVGRGGGWGHFPTGARVANRNMYGPTDRFSDGGLRLLRTSP